MDFMPIGKNIRRYRLTRNLRQEDLAEMTNLSVNYIGALERGEKVPSLETFISITNALGVSADMLLADVIDAGYIAKRSFLSEKLENLSTEEWAKIYDIIDILLKYAHQELPLSG